MEISNQDKSIKIPLCPVCSGIVAEIYHVQDSDTKKKSRWGNCCCGVVFQLDKPIGEYSKADLFCKKTEAQFKYPVTVYAPIIEELMHGRLLLEVGASTHHQSDEFKRRGWLVYTIDKSDEFKSSERRLVSDFETHQFNDLAKFNMVWMYHTLECFNNPLEVLKKCFTVLKEDGILFIATPDTDFINKRSVANFPHWKANSNHIMWNKKSLKAYLESLGFEIVLARSNCWHRFPYTDDCHILAQKRFY